VPTIDSEARGRHAAQIDAQGGLEACATDIKLPALTHGTHPIARGFDVSGRGEFLARMHELFSGGPSIHFVQAGSGQ
jgi:hypothetical protein